MIQVGDRVTKVTGDTHPSGWVASVFATRKGKVRVVVELDYADLLHIYSPEQLAVDDGSWRPPSFVPLAPFKVIPAGACQACGDPSGHNGLPCPNTVITCKGDGT